MDLFFNLILNVILCLVVGVNSARIANDALVLSSVYDAMRSNVVGGNAQRLASSSPGLFNYELRNKRNINEKWDYERQPSEHPDQSFSSAPQQFLKSDIYRSSDLNYGEDASASGNDLICSVYSQNNHGKRVINQNPFLDHENWKAFSTISFFLGKAVKFVLSGLALVSLPLIFLVAIGIPLKVFMTLKAMTVTNSLVFGSLIYRMLNRFMMRPMRPPARPDEDNEDLDLDAGNANNNKLHLNKVGSLDLSLTEEDDYNEERLQKLIEGLKSKNKDW